MNLKNANFICPKMQIRDIRNAFDIGKISPLAYTYELIGEGYLRKVSDRYYAPTEKLIEFITPPSIVLTDHQKRYLANNTTFYWRDLETIFGNELIPKALLRIGYIKLEDSKRYKKDSRLDDLLAEGEEILCLSRT